MCGGWCVLVHDFFFLLCPQLPLLKFEMSMFGHLMVRKLLRKWEFLFDKKSFFYVKLYSIWRFDTFIFLLLRYSHFDCFSKNKEIILNSNQKLFWNSFDQNFFNSYRQALFVFSSVSLWWHLKKSYIRNILRKRISSTGELRASSHRCHIRHDRTTATQFCKHLPKLCFFLTVPCDYKRVVKYFKSKYLPDPQCVHDTRSFKSVYSNSGEIKIA